MKKALLHLNQLILVCTLFLAGSLSAIAQQVIYVDMNKGAAGDGQTWGTAYGYLSNALDAANLVDPATPVEIRVASGVYYPTGLKSLTDRTKTFHIQRGGIKLLGGYVAGSETRNAATNLVYLDGGINAAANTDNSYHIMVINGITAADQPITVDGFTFRNAYSQGATGSSTYKSALLADANGGGILAHTVATGKLTINNCTFTALFSNTGSGMQLTDASPTVTNCTFTKISTTIYGSLGLSITGSSSATVTNCVFNELISTTGTAGGVAVVVNGTGSNTFSNCSFTKGSITGGTSAGGGAMSIGGSTLTLFNCTFSENVANGGTTGRGGAITITGGNTDIVNCTFNANTCRNSGGAIYVSGGNTTVRFSRFTSNSVSAGGSSTGQGGGAINHAGGTLSIANCRFTSNVSGGSGTSNAHGGAIYSNVPCTIKNSFFNANRSIYGAIVANAAAISNCTFYKNISTVTPGTVQARSGNTTTVTNCIFQEAVSTTGVTPTYSRVTETSTGTGNINADPMFVDSVNGNFRLQSTSLCINGGDPAFIQGNDSLDLDSLTRVKDGRVDMGAYEGSLPAAVVSDPMVITAGITGDPGTQVTIPIKANGFVNFQSLQGNLHFGSAVASIDEVTATTALTSISQISGGTAIISNGTVLTYSYDAAGNAMTFADSTTLLNVKVTLATNTSGANICSTPASSASPAPLMWGKIVSGSPQNTVPATSYDQVCVTGVPLSIAVGTLGK
ncbi:MAG: hypothetical protein V4616_06250, partial [Bacteroidota bacterium]